MAVVLLPNEDGSLPTIIKRVNFWRLWAKWSFPALAGAQCACCACTRQPVPASATGQLGGWCTASFDPDSLWSVQGS